MNTQLGFNFDDPTVKRSFKKSRTRKKGQRRKTY